MCLWVKGKRKDLGVHVLKVHLQVHVLWVCLSVFVWVFRAHGTVFEEQGVCSPQLVFRSLLWEVRGVRGQTFNYLPSYHPSFLWHKWEKRTEAEDGPSPPRLAPPWFWTSLTVPASFVLAYICILNSVGLLSFYHDHRFSLRVAAFFEVCWDCLFPWVSGYETN